jgi:hypothetical protein
VNTVGLVGTLHASDQDTTPSWTPPIISGDPLSPWIITFYLKKIFRNNEKNYVAISEVFHVSHSAHGGRGVTRQYAGAIAIRHRFQLGPALETLHGQIYLNF